jgi:hypothetical protein
MSDRLSAFGLLLAALSFFCTLVVWLLRVRRQEQQELVAMRLHQ